LHNIGNTFYYLLLCVSFITGSFYRYHRQRPV
jgi:hypothetical protein